MGAHRLVFDTERLRGRAQRISRHQAKHDARLRRRQPEPVLEQCRLRHSRFLPWVNRATIRRSLGANSRGARCNVQRIGCHRTDGPRSIRLRTVCGRGFARGSARDVIVLPAATTITDIDGLEGYPGPGLERWHARSQVPPRQVTDWLQSRRQDPVSKMDKFLADASAKRACIRMTCSRPVTLTLSVMQYFVPRRVT